MISTAPIIHTTT